MKLVLFFDGECGFCNGAMRKIYGFDRREVIDFARLQGELGRSLGLEKFAIKDGGTMVLLREGDGEKFYKSDAWITLGRALGGGFAVGAGILAVLPKGVRDYGYDLVARYRYLLEGKNDVCGVGDEGFLRRFRG